MSAHNRSVRTLISLLSSEKERKAAADAAMSYPGMLLAPPKALSTLCRVAGSVSSSPTRKTTDEVTSSTMTLRDKARIRHVLATTKLT